MTNTNCSRCRNWILLWAFVCTRHLATYCFTATKRGIHRHHCHYRNGLFSRSHAETNGSGDNSVQQFCQKQLDYWWSACGCACSNLGLSFSILSCRIAAYFKCILYVAGKISIKVRSFSESFSKT